MNQIARELDYIAKMQDLIFTKRRKTRLKNVALIPWNTPPEGSEPLNEFGAMDAVGTPGTTFVVMSYQQPEGWDAILQTFVDVYTGTNLTPNSSNVVWALRVNGLYIKGYQNVRVQFGDLAQGIKINPGVIVKSGQLVEIIATVALLFVPDAGSEIMAGVTGFHYPNGVARTN